MTPPSRISWKLWQKCVRGGKSLGKVTKPGARWGICGGTALLTLTLVEIRRELQLQLGDQCRWRTLSRWWRGLDQIWVTCSQKAVYLLYSGAKMIRHIWIHGNSGGPCTFCPLRVTLFLRDFHFADVISVSKVWTLRLLLPSCVQFGNYQEGINPESAIHTPRYWNGLTVWQSPSLPI